MNEGITNPVGLLLADDLLFTSRITGTARALNLVVKAAGTVDALKASVPDEQPGCIFLDLANPTLKIDELIVWLKENCLAMPRVVAYGSHVDTATLRTARAAGCHEVMPRSQFVDLLPAKLTEWLKPL
ncbi:MAG: response regulator [Gemmataceae bacterium]